MSDSEAKNLRDHSGVFVPPPLIYFVFFIIGMLLQLVCSVRILSPSADRAIGVICIMSGLTLIAWSVQTFWRSKTSVIPVRPSSAIVTGGPFRFTRNPMYIALTLLYLGTAFWLNTLWPIVLLPVLLFLVQSYVIAREERYLERKFGKEYLQYKSRVRKWL
jgi:protein-S-isoprenylcysteine O-methyltransferase Ste14